MPDTTFRNLPTPTTVGKKWGVIVSGSKAAAESWVKRLLTVGCNYFILFMDVRGPAIMYGWADWAVTDTYDGYYVDWW